MNTLLLVILALLAILIVLGLLLRLKSNLILPALSDRGLVWSVIVFVIVLGLWLMIS